MQALAIPQAKPCVFCIDDEPQILELMTLILSNQYYVSTYQNANKALYAMDQARPDLIITDLDMAEISGDQFLAKLRQTPNYHNIPVMFVTAYNESEIRSRVIQLGADDFIAKPFSEPELLSRVQGKIERFQKIRSTQSSLLTMGALSVDLFDCTARHNGNDLNLSLIEFKILSLLVREQGKPIQRSALEYHLWGNQPPASRALDPHIFALRRRLQPTGISIKTIYGKGFILR